METIRSDMKMKIRIGGLEQGMEKKSSGKMVVSFTQLYAIFLMVFSHLNYVLSNLEVAPLAPCYEGVLDTRSSWAPPHGNRHVTVDSEGERKRSTFW